MLSIENVKKAERLVISREQIAIATFEKLHGKTMVDGGVYRHSADIALALDEELAWAIEQFRARRLAGIDAELRALGVEPPQMAEKADDD